MYNLCGFTKSLAHNPYERIEAFGIIPAEKQVSWALEYVQKKIEEANASSCKGLAQFPIQTAASSLVKADSVENTAEHAVRIRELDAKLQNVCLKWNIE